MNDEIDYRRFVDKLTKATDKQSEVVKLIKTKQINDKKEETKEFLSNLAVGCAYVTTQALIWGALIYLCIYENMNPLESIMHVFFFGGELFLIAFFAFAIFPNTLIIYDVIDKRRNKDVNKKLSD
jgi:diphthamide synthase subunit DPH2